MDQISNWKARRAGGRITIKGIDDTGTALKLVGIDVIEVRDGKIVATDRGGEEFHLLVGAQVPEPA